MITPNKVVTVEESAVGHFHIIMNEAPGPINVLTLYNSVRDQFDGVDDFLLTLDALYVLGRVDLDLPTRSVIYAG